MTDAFKQMVVQYCETDDRIKTLQTELKEFKKRYSELGDCILEYMSSNNLEVCNAGELGVLTIATSVCKASLKKETIKMGILELLNNTDMQTMSKDQFAETGADHIMNSRESEERKRLKRKRVTS
jgi:hypothetical protein